MKREELVGLVGLKRIGHDDLMIFTGTGMGTGLNPTGTGPAWQFLAFNGGGKSREWFP